MGPARHSLFVRSVILLILYLLFLRLPLVLAADAQPTTLWEITADEITHERKTDTIVAQGNVVIEKQEKTAPEAMAIHADWVQYNTALETVRAAGNLKITINDDEIKAREALINLGEQTGIFHQAAIFRAPNNLYLTGATIQKTGTNAYWVQDGALTTCTTTAGNTAPWSIHSKDSQITGNGYAKLKHASFWIKNVPVAYVPYILVPADTGRKNGLLFPEISQSKRDGFGLVAPVFIDLAPYRDITLYPGYLAKRGGTAGAEFRYMTSYESYGTLAVNYLNDRTVDTFGDDYKSDGILRTNRQRYWFRGKADHTFANGAVGRLDLDRVSDRDFLQEYKKGLIGFKNSNDSFQKFFHRSFQTETMPFRDNSLQLSKSWTTMAVNGELLAVDDAGDNNGEQTSPWAVPRLLFAGATQLTHAPFDLSWNSEYTYYWRERGSGGHRLDLHPRLIAPLAISPYLETEASAGLRETVYHTDYRGPLPDDGSQRSQNLTRTMYDIDIRTATTLVRDYHFGRSRANNASHSFAALRHILRPELEYTYIPSVDQDELPQFDETDRVAAVNLLRYGFINHFRLNNGQEGASPAREVAYAKIQQYYNGDEDRHPFSDLFLRVYLTPVNDLGLYAETALSMYGQGLTYYDVSTSFNYHQQHKLALHYRYLENANVAYPYFFAEPTGDAIRQIDAGIESKLTKKLAAKFNIAHSISANGTVEANLHLIYHPSCWTVELVANQSPDDTSLMAIVSLEGIGGELKLGLPGL
jgi:LPS-assembly protein